MRNTLSSLLFLLLLSACNQDNSTYKPTSRGLAYELLVILDKPLWQGELGDSLRTVVAAPIPALPQPEPHFRVMQIGEAHFSRQFKTMASILKVTIDPQTTRPSLGIAYNLYATPQIILNLTASSPKEAAQYVGTQRTRILDILIEGEIKREGIRLAKKHHKAIGAKVAQHFNQQIYLPQELRGCKEGEHFLWASEQNLAKELNFCIYTLPYLLHTPPTFEEIVTLRDSVMKIHLRGASDSSYVETMPEHGLVKIRQKEKREFVEVRGIWQMRHEAMGGPFVAHFYPDPTTQTTLVVEGFVYAPGHDKRALIRRIEAALFTLQPYRETIPSY